MATEVRDIELQGVSPGDSAESGKDDSKVAEDSTQVLIRGAAGEFLATFFFLFVTITTVVYSSLDSDSLGAMTTGRHLLVAFVFGMSITTLVYQFAFVSGAHINPAVTVALMATRRISAKQGLVYVAAQVVGAILGTACVFGLDSAVFTAAGGGCNAIPSAAAISNNYGAAFGVEFMGTALLVLTVFAATDPAQGEEIIHINALAPVAIGWAVFLAHLVAIPITGTGINPARSFGPAVVHGCWDGQWLFWVAPILGGVLAGVVFDFVLNKDHAAVLKRFKGE